MNGQTDKNQHTGIKKFFAGVLYAFTGLSVFGVALIGFSAIWAFTKLGDLNIDEIIFQLKTPIEGAENSMIGSYLLQGVLPAVVMLAVYIVLIIVIKIGKRRLGMSLLFLAVSAVVFFAIQPGIWATLNVGKWITGQMEESDFIEDHYVDPASVKITFPAKKRNLIFLYLESMETTYADKASGGAFARNVIPELTKIAMENEDFSGEEKALNGGLVFTGTSFTTGSIFARTVGLPLKLSPEAENLDNNTSFFPDVIALGDILQKEGYRQVFLLGSDATFGGRRLFFTEHGNYQFRDYIYAKEKGWIEPDYKVWWGYEDEKLFGFAKETLAELADGERPFNLTILTVDTHFEDGYVCDLCKDAFGDNQYANVFACSSRQTAEFLSWLQKQDFYKDTTVILCGDHTTMDTDFCDEVSAAYQRKTYTAYINAAAKPVDPSHRRIFSTMDDFPTTLAAMGVSIEGDRLGLGTNLFSEKETLAEQYGADYLQEEMVRRSEFLTKLESADGAFLDPLDLY